MSCLPAADPLDTIWGLFGVIGFVFVGADFATSLVFLLPQLGVAMGRGRFILLPTPTGNFYPMIRPETRLRQTLNPTGSPIANQRSQSRQPLKVIKLILFNLIIIHP